MMARRALLLIDGLDEGCLPRRIPSLKLEGDAFARRASELLLGRIVELMIEPVVLQAASGASRYRPSDISTWAQAMRCTMVGLIARRLCALVAWVHPERLGKSERGGIQKGRESEHGGIQKGGVMEARRRARRAERVSKREECKV